MRVTHGCTRIVILTEHLAIKIAFPFRPFQPAVIFIRRLFDGTLIEKFREKRGQMLRHALRIVTVSGIQANRQEIRLARSYPNYPLAPVLRSYLFGLIIVMPRGEALKYMPRGWDRRAELPADLETDLFNLEHVCKFGKQCRFVDFGHPSAESVLNMLYG